MGIFVSYDTKPVTIDGDATISTGPVAILEAEENTLLVQDISVCNITNQPIRVNLQLSQTIGEATSTAYRLKNVFIGANESINLMKLLVGQTVPSTAGGDLFLQGDPTTETVTSLFLFTNATSQQCNCSVSYITLLETPWGGPC